MASGNIMTSRERVHAAISGRQHDRTPVMVLINPHTACRLMAEFQPSRHWLTNAWGRLLWKRFNKGGRLWAAEHWRTLPLLLEGFVHSTYALELGADAIIQQMGTSTLVRRIYRENGQLRLLDMFGSTRAMGGVYLDVIQPAIRTPGDLKTYRFPDLSSEKFYAPIRKMRQSRPDISILVEAYGVQDLFATQIWKMDAFMMALYDYPSEVKDFQKRFADWSIEVIRNGVRAGADMVFLYDDYGNTGQPQISMKMWREFTFPHLCRIVAAAHDAGAPVMLHSCGYQMCFLDSYVEAGVDVLQSLQPMAGNDFETAMQKYGDRLAFATGIDTQQGEMMTPQQLRESILRAWRIGQTTGRHILGMTHKMQYTMPAANIRAIFDTMREIQSS